MQFNLFTYETRDLVRRVYRIVQSCSTFKDHLNDARVVVTVTMSQYDMGHKTMGNALLLWNQICINDLERMERVKRRTCLRKKSIVWMGGSTSTPCPFSQMIKPVVRPGEFEEIVQG